MIRTKTKELRPAAAASEPAEPHKDNLRETIESIAIAFILAFMFRTFEAEAFVIPTGSMAPTLMGQHKDVACDLCGFRYQVSASDEAERNRLPNADRRLYDVVQATCPMCRFRMSVDRHPPPDGPPPRNVQFDSFHGDRILVSKFAYSLGDPSRWDVAVFKYPERAKDNYIKRIVGLPNEKVRVHRGDIHVKPAGAKEFTIQRKPPHKCAAMLQLVFDNDVVPQIVEHGFPPRWYMSGGDNGSTWHLSGAIPQGGWQPADQHTRYATDGSSANPVWLRYEHRQPMPGDWIRLDQGRFTPEHVLPQLISDSYAYNGNVLRNQLPGLDRRGFVPGDLGLHWVGDLAVECELDVQSSQGTVVLELVKAGVGYQCRFELDTGDCLLSAETLPEFLPKATGVLRGPGKYRVRFANVDDKLFLWVGGSVVKFDKPTEYSNPDHELPTRRDLAPIGIASQGATVSVSRLRVLRDVYYVATSEQDDQPGWPYESNTKLFADYTEDIFLPLPGQQLTQQQEDELRRLREEPFETRMTVFLQGRGPRGWSPIKRLRSVEFELRDDQYLAFGDNSPRSADSRMWRGQYFVSRDLLIGKAMYVYWPHAWPLDWSVPVGFGGFRFNVPFVPNFSRMKLIQ